MAVEAMWGRVVSVRRCCTRRRKGVAVSRGDGERGGDGEWQCRHHVGRWRGLDSERVAERTNMEVVVV